jgi:hypothetical protein
MTGLATQSPAEFLSAAPKSVTGSSPWASRYAIDIRRAWLEFAAEDARTVQRHLGPSELGVPCDRQVAGKMAELPATNHVVDPWPSVRGKALHRHAEDVFAADNARHNQLRWITEQRVTPHPEHPGTADLYDARERAVVDHKFLGESSMAKIRKIVPAASWEDRAAKWPRHYLVQLLLYGLGYHLLGLPVRRVVLLAYPATAGSIDGLYVADIEWANEDGSPRPEVVALLTRVFEDTNRRKGQAEHIRAGRIGLMDVPADPDDDTCYWCPFYRPQAARDGGAGCPGSRTGATR